MENGTNEHSDYLEKRFDYYDIDWVIENFCVATCRDKWVIRSPVFTIKGFQSSTWLMTLHCEKCDSGDILRLTIKRSFSDAGPDLVWVDWRSSIPGFLEDFGLSFLMSPYDKGMSCYTDLGNVEDVIKKFNIFDSDSLMIHSKLIFFTKDDHTEFEPCRDSGVKALSDKLLQLFRSKVHHDLELKFEDDPQGIRMIPVHKVVVCSRIKELNYLIEKDGTRVEDENGEHDVLDLSCLNYDAMRKILEYTYSGNLKFILEMPTFEIYDCIDKLQISELKPFFIPNKLVFRTVVDCQELKFTWVIPNVKDLLKQEFISSPLFSDGCSDKYFQIHFAPTENSDGSDSDYSDFYGVHIQAKESGGRHNACFECAIADENNSFYFLKRSRIFSEDTETYGISKYVRKNIVKYFEDQKFLKIVVRLRLSNGMTCSCIAKHNVTFTDYTSSDKSFELLWTSMQDAYETGLFSDAQILVSDTTINLHKSVLYARCAKLYLLVNHLDQKEFYFAEIKPRIFHMVMKYLYTGIAYNNENEADVTEIYDLAAELHLSFLKSICSAFMRVLIQNNLSIREKVTVVAEKHKDDCLLEALKQCISDQEEN